MRKTAILGILVLFAVLVIPAASASEYYLDPDNSSVAINGDLTEVAIWIDATENIRSGKIAIGYDSLCGNITSCTRNTTVFLMGTAVINHAGENLTITYLHHSAEQPAGKYHIANFTIQCNSTTYCTSDLLFVYQTYMSNDTIDWFIPMDNGTFTCGTPPSAETFSRSLYEGWNLISLPLDPAEDNSASAVLSGVSYDAVYRYNATSKQFEGVESDDVMEQGTGYFVHVTAADCTWTYSGTAYTSMDVPLEQGLNMVGWLNCSKGIGDALSSISEDYYYVARWDTSAQKFEVHNPVAPPAFNDFATMDRGTGYFISAKQECALSENC